MGGALAKLFSPLHSAKRRDHREACGAATGVASRAHSKQPAPTEVFGSMETRSVAAVIGGSGFLGRYIVKRLAAAGHIVRVAVRDPEAALFLKPMGRVGQVVPLYANITQEGTLARAVEGADMVINLVGILAERSAGEFDRVQAEGAGRIAAVVGSGGGAAFAACLCHRGGCAEPVQIRSQQGRGRAAGAVGVPARGDPAALPGVRARGPVF